MRHLFDGDRCDRTPPALDRNDLLGREPIGLIAL